MAHTLTNLLTHVIFSTKDRAPLITPDLKPEMCAYLGGVVRELEGTALNVNAVPDHVHLLVKLPPRIALSEVVGKMKASSSGWVKRKWQTDFAWQAGYGGFSVSQSNVPAVANYIANQEQHHKRVVFREEFVAFLKKHEIEYDERYLWE